MGKEPKYVSAEDLLERLFSTEFKGDGYDPEIVDLVKKHLGGDSIHSRAGNRLAEDLVSLAKNRAVEDQR